MTYKFYTQEIEPFRLADGSISSISIGQHLNSLTGKWNVDITFTICDVNNKPWDLLMAISMNDYKEFYINNILDFLNYNKNRIEKLSIQAFEQELVNLKNLNKSKLIQIFTAKNPKLKEHNDDNKIY